MMNDPRVAEGTDAFAVIATLAEVADVRHAADAYRETMRRAYWEDKDVHVVVAVAYSGVSRLLAAAADPAVDEETEYELRSAAKGLTHDLASFTWIGWDEPDVVIDASLAIAGHAAARANLSMAYTLDKGDLAISRAHWTLGAHLLTSGDLENAAISFDEAERHAIEAGATSEAHLALAYAALTELAAGRADESELRAALDRLRLDDGGEGFVAQVETTRRVIGV